MHMQNFRTFFTLCAKKSTCLEHVFVIVINAVSLLCFCIVLENKGFLSLSPAAKASNQHLNISSKGRNGCCFNEMLKQLVAIPQEFCKISFRKF